MARTLEQERAAIETDVRKLEERRQRLEEKDRESAIQAIEKTGLHKLETKRLGTLLGRVRRRGLDEVEKRRVTGTRSEEQRGGKEAIGARWSEEWGEHTKKKERTKRNT